MIAELAKLVVQDKSQTSDLGTSIVREVSYWLINLEKRDKTLSRRKRIKQKQL